MLARCLERAGAKTADNMSDLGFFVREEGDASTGFIYDRQLNALVRIWQMDAHVSSELSPWAVWAADPFPGDGRTVRELLDERPRRSFVMYMRDASKRQRDEGDSCIAAVESREKRHDAPTS